MSIKIFGAILVIVGCGGFGFKYAANRLREERTLRELAATLDYMGCELQYRLTPLPELCRQASEASKGIISKIFYTLALELESQISPDAEQCMKAVLANIKDIPKLTLLSFEQLGRSIGRFDVDGQLKGLEAVRQECRRNLEILAKDRDMQIRTFQTLGHCAGAAIAILFI